MEYISVKETAKKWKLDVSRVTRLAREGRINGAIIVARNWLIPKDAKKPIDSRTKNAKIKNYDTIFRFPLYVNCAENDFNPPLNDEEKTLRKAELDFYACEFENAKIVFENILKTTNNIYIKIMSLFYLCSLSIEVYSGQNFNNYYHQLQMTLMCDFPYKKEMEIVNPWLYIILAQFSSVSESLNLDFEYNYSPSVIQLLSFFSFYHIAKNLHGVTTHVYVDSYELLCRQIEKNNAYYEACESQFVMFSAYYFTLNENAMLYHLKKGLDIAKEHNFLLLPASYLHYYPDAFNKIASEYPGEFIEKIKHNSKILSKSFSDFNEKNDSTKIYCRLSSKDYRFIMFAVNGCANKEIAKILHISERTVNNKFSKIYDKLDISNKQELLKIIKNSYVLNSNINSK